MADLNDRNATTHTRSWTQVMFSGRRALVISAVAALGIVAMVLVTVGAFRTPSGSDDSSSAGAEAVEDKCSAGGKLFVAVNGTAENDGSEEHPLDLVTALSSKSPAKPCDTIWVRGGTYKGAFTSDLKGTDGSPITVRAYAAERATIDSAPERSPGLTAGGEWAIFWGLEITNSDHLRTSNETAGWPSDLKRGSGVIVKGSHLKFVDLVVHDVTRGFEIGAEAIDTEVYGNLIYNNGWSAPNKSSGGHGIVVYNQVGTKRFIDNVIFNQFSHGILALGSDTSHVDGITVEGNIMFNNGAFAQSGYERDVLIGGGPKIQNPILRNNSMYGGAQTQLGFGSACSGGIVRGNYEMADHLILNKCTPTVTDNTLYGSLGTLQGSYPNNTYIAGHPTGLVVRIRPDRYEAGRATLAVYNWDGQPQVNVDLSGVRLANGSAFEIRDAENFYGPPVSSGVYNGQPVSLNMTGLTVGPAVGQVPMEPKHTAPEFGAFVVMMNRTPPPAKAATPPTP